MKSKLQPNDLIKIEPWDCEGIEQPWGWFPDNPPPLTKLRNFKKVKLKSGSTGIVIENPADIADFEEHCIVLVESKALSVPVRFLNQVD